MGALPEPIESHSNVVSLENSVSVLCSESGCLENASFCGIDVYHGIEYDFKTLVYRCKHGREFLDPIEATRYRNV